MVGQVMMLRFNDVIINMDKINDIKIDRENKKVTVMTDNGVIEITNEREYVAFVDYTDSLIPNFGDNEVRTGFIQNVRMMQQQQQMAKMQQQQQPPFPPNTGGRG